MMRTESHIKPDPGGHEAREARSPRAQRPQADAESIQQFAQILARADSHEASTRMALADGPEPLDTRESRFDANSLADPNALNLQRLAFEPPSQQTPPAVATATLADMIERHVRQMLVDLSSASVQGERGQLMLRMSDDTLPATDLMLSRTEQGWSLNTASADAETAAMIREAAPALVERFEAMRLGALEVKVGSRDA
ncbi:hypothetical protein RM530_12645 [Algiphilus sp. W345]|uniref:Flagellar hook-length control protein-like C-terminal domain-containing protein n=1 Tax=Banduia mediterranea TaxID=3075609 RepID=A0ABU2WMB8_9GAMM|nr:hypothetical protein [Algiphilus sp. W345]MDT0498207.1 hypothetical protein [Algiphilus sp. W345]